MVPWNGETDMVRADLLRRQGKGGMYRGRSSRVEPHFLESPRRSKGTMTSPCLVTGPVRVERERGILSRSCLGLLFREGKEG